MAPASWRRRVAAVVVLLLLSGCGADGDRSTASGAPVAPSATVQAGRTPPPAPTIDAVIPTPPPDFYAVPDPLPAGKPGSLVWAEPVAAPEGARAWRVLYHSRSVGDRDIAVSGLVIAPDRPPPPGGFPVIGYAHGSTGLADACAPSRGARPATGSPVATDDFPVPSLWESGFVVAATDYEGLGTPGRHPYVVGLSEGRGVLDSVRAARELPDAHAGARTAVLGASQGGHATLFAGEIQPAYAPDVPLLGVVALAPASELERATRLLAGDPEVVGLAVAIAAGFAAAYPDADLSTVLTPAAMRDVHVVDEGCLEDIVATFSRPVDQVFRIDRMVLPPWPELLEENSPGRVATVAPIFVAQGGEDPLVVPELTEALVDRLCEVGDRVTYRRYPGASHVGVAEAAGDDIARWLGARFMGFPASSSDCAGR
jgi:acetyl esterase/lipase